jgi:salicylate hydroxylase
MPRPRRPELSADRLPIAVIGGGIAGLACAVALGRRGHAVTVFEKRVAGSEVGAGLQLSPNASHILMRWGLGPQLAESAVAPSNLAIRRWAEPRAYAEMPMLPGADGAPFWVMLRADLHDALRRAAFNLPGVTVREGHAFDGLRDEGGVKRLRFMAGEQQVRAEAGVVIGADGQWSRMRKELGDSRSLDPPSWEAWRTVVPAERAQELARAATTNLWLGRDSHAVHYPVAGGRLINLVVIRRSKADGEGWSRTGDPAELAGLAAAAAPTLRELMAQAPEWSVWTVRDRIPATRLVRGALALAGDAAHPVLPFLAQGAAMAIEDAEVIAASLPSPDRLTPEAAAAGLLRSAAARAGRVHRVFKASRQNAFAYHLPGPLAWFRDRRIDKLGPDGMRERYEWLYGWRAPGGAG